MPAKPYSSTSLFERQSSAPEDAIIIHVDGGARGNPGPAGYGVVVEDSDGNVLAEFSHYLGIQTNNVAEYSGLIAGLEYAQRNGHKAVRVMSDSELMVRQMNGVYKVRSPELKELYDRARAIARWLQHFAIEHVRREANAEADRLANEAMDAGMRAAFPRGENRDVAVNRERLREGAKREFNGIVKDGRVELLNGDLPEGTLVKVTVKSAK